MTTQGDAILRDLVDSDIKRLEELGASSPCANCGMLTILKCKRSELSRPTRKSGVLPVTGWSTIIGTLAYLVLKAHNLVP